MKKIIEWTVGIFFFVISLILIVCLSFRGDLITFIAYIGSLLGLWIAILSLYIITNKHSEFKSIFAVMGEGGMRPFLQALGTLLVIALLFCTAMRANYLYSLTEKNIGKVTLELLCVFCATCAYVYYDLRIISSVRNAYIRRLKELNKTWVIRKGCWNSEESKHKDFDMLVRRWISAHKTSFSRVDLPVTLALLLSMFATAGIYYVYIYVPEESYEQPEIFRTFVSGVICFHGLLASYLFVVHCSGFISPNLESFVNKLRLNLPVDCNECPFLWQLKCAVKGTKEYEEIKFVCPQAGSQEWKGLLVYPSNKNITQGEK